MPLLQAELDAKNVKYWSELCGSNAAKQLKINDSSSASLKKFDDWYFSIYPYLKKNYVTPENSHGKVVLEVGLGYGTVSQYLAGNAHSLVGVDLAEEPVNFLNHRLKLIEKPQTARTMSAHQLDFQDNFFDFVVSIGCFHHTGNVKKCIDEAYRVLKPGGKLLFMCYNQYSYREYLLRPFKTFSSLLKESRILNDSERYNYDHNLAGTSAPFTELFGKKKLKNLCKDFSSCRVKVENVGGPFRKYLLNNLGKVLGTDLYVQCIK